MTPLLKNYHWKFKFLIFTNYFNRLITIYSGAGSAGMLTLRLLVALLVSLFVTCQNFDLDELKSNETLAVKCYISGLSIVNNQIVEHLFNGKIQHRFNSTLILSMNEDSVKTKLLVAANNEDATESYCDVAIQFIKPSALYDETHLLLEIQKTLKAVLKSSKKSIILL